MTYPIKIHEAANHEYIAAYQWYELKRVGLGDRFMENVENLLNRISQHPKYFGKRKSHFREAKVAYFPFMIVYEFIESQRVIHVLAIYHASRNPKRKYRKMK